MDPFAKQATDQAQRRLENTQERRRLAAHLAARDGASVSELVIGMLLPSGHVHALLRTMRKQGVVAKRADGKWELTGLEPQRRPRKATPKAHIDGIPKIKHTTAVQCGLARDPLVAALFGPRAG